MKLDGEYFFDDSVKEVWDALFDPAVLAAVMPGCEKLELVDGSYVGEIKVKVGPIQGKFSGKVELLDIVEPQSYRMIVDGRGAQGFVKANAEIKLSIVDGRTRIVYTSEAQVGGKIASVGQRLIETSARAIVKESLQGLAENVKIRAEAHRKHAAENLPVPPTEIAMPSFKMPAKPTSEPAARIAKAAAATEPATASETVTPAAETAGAVAAATAIAAADSAPVVVPKPAPVIEYKRADAKKLAGAVAKEVGKSLAPIIAIVAIVIAAVIYLLVR
jgi:hypothetical protein